MVEEKNKMQLHCYFGAALFLEKLQVVVSILFLFSTIKIRYMGKEKFLYHIKVHTILKSVLACGIFSYNVDSILIYIFKLKKNINK